jgi:hypothetical protein
MMEDEVFAQEQAFDVVAAYKVAAVYKMEGDDIGIRSHTNRSSIGVVGKAFEGEVVVKQVLDY